MNGMVVINVLKGVENANFGFLLHFDRQATLKGSPKLTRELTADGIGISVRVMSHGLEIL
jgi:hypothetical protein